MIKIWNTGIVSIMNIRWIEIYISCIYLWITTDIGMLY